MNKKLLAAAIVAAMAAPAANAAATMYGKFHTSIDYNDKEFSSLNSAGDPQPEDNWEVNSRASRVGIKGSEDLGGGLKAIYQLELGFNSSGGGRGQSGGSSVFGGSTRNTFVGLAGGFGTFLVGRHDTPAKVAFYATGNDRLGDSVIDLNLGNNLSGNPSGGAPIGVFHEYRANDAIAYISPNFAGFTVAAAVIPGEDTDFASTTGGPTTPVVTCKNDRNGLADHYSIGLMYAGGGLKAGAGYAKYDLDPCGVPSLTSPELDDYKVIQIGASYTFGAFSVGAQYEDSSNVGGVKRQDYQAWAITGKATFGNNAISLVYTDAKLENVGGTVGGVRSNDDFERGGWGIAGEHNFSKRTKAYAAYADGSNKDKPSGSSSTTLDDKVFSLGMIHNF